MYRNLLLMYLNLYWKTEGKVDESQLFFQHFQKILSLQNSWTALLVAARGGFTEVVHQLLDYDPNVNAVDKVHRNTISVDNQIK